MSGDAPLAGIRVLELGNGVAAPVACRNLAQFGADVVRIESERRPDILRVQTAGWLPPDFDWRVSRDTGASLNFTCPGKRSIGLELDSPHGREVFERLLERSDVLAMNMSLDAVRDLRVSYEDVRAVNPSIIWMNMPAFGAKDGPYARFRTWGRNLAAACGVSHLIGWPDRPPVGTWINYPDFVGALWGSIAVVCALLRRDITGEGCEIDVAQYQLAISCIGPAVIEAVLGGDGLGSRGNRRDGCAPHGLYPTRGNDRWVAISVTDEQMWDALCDLEGLRHMRADDRFTTLAGRLANQDALDVELGNWTCRRTHWEAAAYLQSVGVPAAPVLDNFEILADPQLQAREFFRVLPHARFGAELTYGQAIVLSETSAAFEQAAPAFGEHTRAVLRDVVELTDTEIDALLESGTAFDMPHPDLRLERPYLHWIAKLLPEAWPTPRFDPLTVLYERMASLTLATPDDGVKE
jgi:benzylsuccinate CoA-transferase BbsF subunit